MRARCADVVVTALLVALGLSSSPLLAQDAPTQFLIPYQGTLERNGMPLAGDASLRVGLFATAAPTEVACLATGVAGCGLWADEFVVPVQAGSFSVLLGSNTAIPMSVLARSELYIGLAVHNGTSWVTLQGLQRLVSTPYAVRARSSYDLTVDRQLLVAGTVGIGTPAPNKKLEVDQGELRVRASNNSATPDIGAFVANNQTQGIGIGYNQIAALGSNTDQDIRLVPRGGGAVAVDGTLTAQATQNEAGNLATYQVNLRRYKVVALQTNQNPIRSYTPVPLSVLDSYCGDEDGCRITLRMRDWAGSAGNAASRTATSFSLHMHYGADVGGQRCWRREAVAAPGNTAMSLGPESGIDNNNATEHVLRNHNCYFTDAVYTPPGSQADTALGMGLLNYNADPYDCTCELIIDD